MEWQTDAQTMWKVCGGYNEKKRAICSKLLTKSWSMICMVAISLTILESLLDSSRIRRRSSPNTRISDMCEAPEEKTKTYTVKPALSDHSKIGKTKILKTNGSLMKVERIAECSPWSILQCFWPALSYNRSWNQIFGLLLSGRLRQVLLYCTVYP